MLKYLAAAAALAFCASPAFAKAPVGGETDYTFDAGVILCDTISQVVDIIMSGQTNGDGAKDAYKKYESTKSPAGEPSCLGYTHPISVDRVKESMDGGDFYAIKDQKAHAIVIHAFKGEAEGWILYMEPVAGAPATKQEVQPGFGAKGREAKYEIIEPTFWQRIWRML